MPPVPRKTVWGSGLWTAFEPHVNQHTNALLTSADVFNIEKKNWHAFSRVGFDGKAHRLTEKGEVVS